jgi:hypothetical protein
VKLSRFERRILAAIIAVALVTLGGALWFGQGAVSEAYRVGVNRRVLRQLEQSLTIYRRHFVALRDDAERTADAVAYDRRAYAARDDLPALTRFLEGALSRYPYVARVVVEREDGTEIARAERDNRLDKDHTQPPAHARAAVGRRRAHDRDARDRRRSVPRASARG